MNDILNQVTDPYSGPVNNLDWVEFFELLEMLPQENREISDLIWLQGLNQKQTAMILGISLRTVIRRWIKTKLEIRRLMDDELRTHGFLPT